jgi:hypothetical protein
MLFFQAERFFERIVVRFTRDKGQVLIFDPFSLMLNLDAGSGTGLMQLMIFIRHSTRVSIL